MDNVTHSLTGLALSRSGLDRLSPHAVWLLLLSANAPDADIVATSQGAFRYLEVHRGYTHSLLGMPVMAALCVLLVAAISRSRLPWLRAWMLCLIGVASHLLLDLTNSYGIRLFIPFSPRWFHLDWNSLYDIWILAVLAFAAVWPLFVRLINREIGDRRTAGFRSTAVAALLFFALFDLGRATLHARAVAQLESRMYDGAAPLETAALPDPYNPLHWISVVETERTYELSSVNPVGEWVAPVPAVFYKPPVTPGLRRIESIDPFRFFLYFARFPVWSQQPVTGEQVAGRQIRRTRYDLTDLRFGIPQAGSFHCIAVEDQLGEVISKWFTYGSGMNLGWEEANVSSSASR